MPKKKLQFLVNEKDFQVFESIRRSRYSSTAKQTLLHSIFSEWLIYQQRGGSRVWELLKNGVMTILPPIAPIRRSTLGERACVALTKMKNTRTAIFFISGICVISPVRQFRSSPVGFTNFWTNVSLTNISSLIPLRANSLRSYTGIFSFGTETSDENSFRS